MQLSEIVETIVKAMVETPEKVKVQEIRGDNSSLIELSVDKRDMGIVIGRQGQNAQAIRTILSAVASKMKKRVILDVVD